MEVENSSTENPFFLSSIIESKDYQLTNNLLNEEDKIIFNKLPKELRILYSKIGSNHEYHHKSGLTFLTLSEIKRREKSHNNFLDIAISYAGLGHVNVLGYHYESKKYFIRMDGGSNGYEREENYNYYKNYQPKEEELKTLDKILIELD